MTVIAVLAVVALLVASPIAAARIPPDEIVLTSGSITATTSPTSPFPTIPLVRSAFTGLTVGGVSIAFFDVGGGGDNVPIAGGRPGVGGCGARGSGAGPFCPAGANIGFGGFNGGRVDQFRYGAIDVPRGAGGVPVDYVLRFDGPRLATLPTDGSPTFSFTAPFTITSGVIFVEAERFLGGDTGAPVVFPVLPADGIGTASFALFRGLGFDEYRLISADLQIIPEPGTLLLVGSGLVVLGGTAWRQYRRRGSDSV